MIVYILLIILTSTIGYILDKSNKENNKKLYKVTSLIPFMLLFIVSAIRYNVGKDYSGTYTELYYGVKYGSLEDKRIDIGFLLLLKVIIFCGFDLQMVFAITSLIINYFVYKSIEKQSKYKALSYYIYICSTFYFFTMNGIRQSIAIAMFYYSLTYAKEKNWKKYFVINIIGALFHQTAVIFLPLYFLLNKKKKNKKIYVIILIITYVFSNMLTPILLQWLSNTKYSLYILNDNYSTLEKFNFSSILNLFYMVLYIFLAEKDDEMAYNYFICHWIGAEFSIFLVSIPLALRIFESFRFIDFLSVPYLIKNTKKLNNIIVKIMVIAFYFAYFIYHIYLNNANSVLPYLTIFER